MLTFGKQQFLLSFNYLLSYCGYVKKLHRYYIKNQTIIHTNTYKIKDINTYKYFLRYTKEKKT